MRAVDSGTAINCPKCGGVWLYRLMPKPVFAPLATPKRKRGPKRYHPKEDE
jgi:Zn-finger nucleic acid-binding protein